MTDSVVLTEHLQEHYPDADADFVRALERPPLNIPPGKLEELRRSVARGLSDDQILYFVEVCLVTGLNPFAGDVFAKTDSENGGAGRVLIYVKRDGLIRMAEGRKDFRGYDCGVVYEGDTFSAIEPDPDAGSIRGRAGVVHTITKPENRGDIICAWAVVERENRPPRLVISYWEDYAPENPTGLWLTKPAVMMEKTPLNHGIRTIFGFSGIYSEEELAQVGQTVNGGDLAPPIDPKIERDSISAWCWGLAYPEPLRKELWKAIVRHMDAIPNQLRLAHLQVKITGQNEEGVRRIIRELDDSVAGASRAPGTTTRSADEQAG